MATLFVRLFFLTLLTASCATGPYFRSSTESLDVPGLERSTTVRWGNPLAAKPPRVLFVLPRIAERDAMELALRLDMAYEAVLLESTPAGAEADSRFDDLQNALERGPDLLVLANIDFGRLPAAVLERIRDHVHDGMGVLLANHQRNMPEELQHFLRELAPVESTSPITRGIGAKRTPEWQGGLDFVQAATYGSGRVVQLNYPGTGPVYHALLPELLYPEKAEWAHYETYWSLIAKAALWAAHREPSQRIDRILKEARQEEGFEELPPGMTQHEMHEYVAATDTRMLHTYRLHLNAPAKERYEIVAQLRQPGRQWRTRIRQPGEPFEIGEENFPLTIPAIPGRFYLDTWLKNKDKTVDWHSVPTTIETRPFFDKLRTGREVVLANDTIRVTFELLPSQRTEDGLQRCIMALRATDAHGRQVGFSTNEAPGPRRTYTARLDVADLISNRLNLECMVFSHPLKSTKIEELHLLNTGGTKLPLGVRLPGPVYPFALAVANHASQEYTLRSLNRLLADAGVTSIVVPAREDAARFVPETGQTPVFQLLEPWTPRDLEALAAEGEIPEGAPPPASLEQLTHDIRQVHIGVADGFLLGGPNGFNDTWKSIRSSSAVMDEFRSRLWAEFEEPASLGPEWASRFKTWENLSIETIEQAADDGFFEPWMRFHRHIDGVFLRLYEMAQGAIRAPEPLAPVGFSMTASPDGINPLWYDTAAAIELIAVPPDRVSMARTAAYRVPEAQTTLCVPGADTPEEARWWPWHTLLNQYNGLWWNLEAGPEDVMDGPGSIDAVFTGMLEQTRAVSAGFADLFLKAAPAKAPIAVYDSRASELLNASRKDAPRASLAGALGVLETLGFATELVASDDARRDRLTKHKYLFLPGVDALSDAEINRIRAFSRAGGLVLADTPAGAFDEFGRMRKNLPLADLFTDLNLRQTEPAPEQGSTPSPAPQDSPRAYLLNAPFREGFNEQSLRLLESILGNAGCEKLFEVSGDKPFEGQRFRFEYGKAEIYAALASPEQPGRTKYRLVLPENGHVYNIRTGLEVRGPQHIRWRAAPGGVALFSTLPYRVTAVEAALPNTIRPGNRLNVAVQILTEDHLPGEHLVFVRLRPLGGNPISYYDKTFVCKEGQGTTFIPLAMDEPPGFYKVVVRDVLTGMVSEWPIEITSGLGEGVDVTIKPES